MTRWQRFWDFWKVSLQLALGMHPSQDPTLPVRLEREAKQRRIDNLDEGIREALDEVSSLLPDDSQKLLRIQCILNATLIMDTTLAADQGSS